MFLSLTLCNDKFNYGCQIHRKSITIGNQNLDQFLSEVSADLEKSIHIFRLVSE
jgi:hypothetical protein